MIISFLKYETKIYQTFFKDSSKICFSASCLKIGLKMKKRRLLMKKLKGKAKAERIEYLLDRRNCGTALEDHFDVIGAWGY